jgi:membrane fusion protein, copper/silver efflux system
MSSIRVIFILALGLSLGAAGQYWYAHRQNLSFTPDVQIAGAAASGTTILYYRDPSGAPNWSATPKKDAAGRPFLPVYDEEEVSFDPKPPAPKEADANRKVLYYRNPMGLPDTSPVPKKDSMGMSYIPVYEGEESDDGKTVKVSLDKVQRSGVRTERAQARVLVRSVRAVGTVTIDETRQTVVSMRAETFIEDLFVNATGKQVRAGEPLFRAYIPEVQKAQADLISTLNWPDRLAGSGAVVNGAETRLRNLGIPESRIQEVRQTKTNPRTIDWPAPATGTVFSKNVIKGQRVDTGQELYRIVDLTHVWVIAEVAESDLSAIKIGTPVLVTLRAYPDEPIEGQVGFIYPDIKSETRTARVRIELLNPEGRLKTDMYADVVFRPGAERGSVLAVSESAVIDSGTQQFVLVAKGEGRFEPRAVKPGLRGEGYVEIREGVTAGEEVVTTATFLIDAESNLQTALKTFTTPPPAVTESSR